MKINRKGVTENMNDTESLEYSKRSIGNLIDITEERWYLLTETEKLEALFLLVKKTNGR
jgi:hypothetical protein